MPILIYISLVCWIPLCLLLFMVLPPQRAVVVAVVGGWLVLPPTGIPLPGFPDYDKVMAPIAGVTLGTLIFQPNRLLAFRPKWFDLPALFWCFCPLMSSLANGLGAYDGMAAMLVNIVRWALPYLIGRLYFGTKEGMRELAVGIAIGGMIWVLPCLFEIRMSPILQSTVYGISRYEGKRLGGWRPFVFFATGLELGMWMTASSLTAVWLWWSGSLNRLGRLPFFTWLLPVLLITTWLCRASGALALLIVGLTILWLGTRLGTRFFLCALLLVPPVYYAVRIPNYWSGSEFTDFIATYLNKERAGSLAFRFEKENLLARRAMLQPVWGWGGWGRNRIVDEQTGRDIAPTDGMWIIFLGTHGSVGLLTWTTMMLLPSWLFTLRFPARQWRDPTISPLAVMATLLGLYVVDCLVNGFLNLSYVVGAGGLVGVVQSAGKTRRTTGKSSNEDKRAALHAPRAIGQGLEDLPPGSDGQTTGASVGGARAQSPQERLADRYKQLARTLRAQGQPAEAKAMLTHAFHLLSKLASTQPDAAEIQKQRWDCANDLAWLLLNEPDPATRDPRLAVDLAQQATQAQPESATYWNTLGAAYHCIGDSVAAITALERSMTLGNGGTAYDYVFLALSYIQLGQHDKAQHWIAQTECWMEQHEPGHPELLHLCEQARVQVKSDHKPALP